MPLISLWLTTHADRIGRRKVLLLGAGLMALAGVVFAASDVFVVLLAAAVVGVISPSGHEVGPFLAVEQASLAQTTPDRERTRVLAWWNLVASFSTAAGALAGGAIAQALLDGGWAAADAYRAVIVGYAIVGLVLAALFARGVAGSRGAAGASTSRSRAGWACTARSGRSPGSRRCSRSTRSAAGSWSSR